METAIAIADQLAGMQKFGSSALASVQASSYLPRLQLMTASHDTCKEGKFPINHYAIIDGGNNIDVGAETDILFIAWRPQALDMNGDTVVAVYDHESEAYKSIIERANTVKDSGCMYGPQFLVYHPGQGKFATLFLGSKSARRETNACLALLGKASTLKSKLVEWKGYKWQTIVVTPCNTPFDIPDMEAIKAEVEKFNNPTTEGAPEVAEADSRAR